MNAIETAWCAGLFEGEGTISIYRYKPTHCQKVTVRVKMTDEDVITKLGKITGVGNVRPVKVPLGRKPAYIWTLQARIDTLNFLESILPHLGERRREKTLEALKILDKIPYSRDHY